MTFMWFYTALQWKYHLFCLRLVFTSDGVRVGEEPNQSQSVGTCILIGLSFRFCFRLRTIWFSLDHKRSHKRRNRSQKNQNVSIFFRLRLRLRRLRSAYDLVKTRVGRRSGRKNQSQCMFPRFVIG